MIEALKSLLTRAAKARTEGHGDDAERLYKEAAAQARAQDTVGRAEALVGAALTRRDRNDRAAAALYLAEAITLLRNAHTKHPEFIASTLAYALRHAADIRSELGEFSVASSHIHEAVRLYRSIDPQPDLELAHALRVEALNNEREAIAAWKEAARLYTLHQHDAGNKEAEAHLHCLTSCPTETITLPNRNNHG